MEKEPVFIDNAAVKARPDHYALVTVDVPNILKSWKESLFSYEWMRPDGSIKTIAELSPAEAPKRQAVEDSLKKSEKLERPVLGIGLLENVEIGAGRATFLTLAALGLKEMSVHIPKSVEKEFASFLPGAAPKKARTKKKEKSESGNVLFIILIAVAMLGALSMAISQSGRSSTKDITDETRHLMATSMLEYSDAVYRAAMQLRARGIAATALNFANPGSGNSNEIFNPSGAAMVYRAPDPAALTTAGNWIFFATEQLAQTGTTCATAACTELMMGVRNVRLDVCLKINELLDITNPSGAPPAVAAFTTTPAWNGTFNAPAHTIAGSFTAQNAGCLRDTGAGDYVFYQVILAR